MQAWSKLKRHLNKVCKIKEWNDRHLIDSAREYNNRKIVAADTLCQAVTRDGLDGLKAKAAEMQAEFECARRGKKVLGMRARMAEKAVKFFEEPQTPESA